MRQAAMDHWTTVKRIHQCALDVPPSERAAFVAESCGGDKTVLSDVQSLLSVRGGRRVILGTAGIGRGAPATG